MKKMMLFLFLFSGALFAKELEFELEIADFYNPAAVDNETAMQKAMKALRIEGEYRENVNYEAICAKINCAVAEVNMRTISKEASKEAPDFHVQGNTIRFKLPILKDMRLVTIRLYLTDAGHWTELSLTPTILDGALENPYPRENPNPPYQYEWITKKQVKFSAATQGFLWIRGKATLTLSLLGKDGNASGNLIRFDNHKENEDDHDFVYETAVTIGESNASSPFVTEPHSFHDFADAGKGFYLAYGALEVTGMIKQIAHDHTDNAAKQKIISTSYIEELRYARNGKLFMILGNVEHESQVLRREKGKEEREEHSFNDIGYQYKIYFSPDKPRAMYFGYLPSTGDPKYFEERYSKINNKNIKEILAEHEKKVFDDYANDDELKLVPFKKSLEYVERISGASDKALQKEFDAYKNSVILLEVKK
jgi:hypothetical protein